MASLAATSLGAKEHRSLDRFLASVRHELGDDLLAVWLYGSRARGEPARDWTDVDLMVVTTRGEADWERIWDLAKAAGSPEGGDAPDLMILAESPKSLAEMRAKGSFLLKEVERDAVVLLGGEVGELTPSPKGEPSREQDGLMTRTHEYLDQARYQLEGARTLVNSTTPALAAAEAYFAVLNAARAALSERDLFARSHDGTWDLTYKELVLPGLLPRDFHRWAKRLQGKREEVHYKCMRLTPAEAADAYAAAERFVRGVEKLLGA
jgi:predicted nucleotidyltransferase/uncharacterized protein (UPF0332 family)